MKKGGVPPPWGVRGVALFADRQLSNWVRVGPSDETQGGTERSWRWWIFLCIFLLFGRQKKYEVMYIYCNTLYIYCNTLYIRCNTPSYIIYTHFDAMVSLSNHTNSNSSTSLLSLQTSLARAIRCAPFLQLWDVGIRSSMHGGKMSCTQTPV